MMWQVKDENDQVVFESPFYQEALRYYHNHNDLNGIRYYIDFVVVEF